MKEPKKISPRKVFIYDTGAADEKFFRHEFYKSMTSDDDRLGNFRQYLWDLIYQLNNNGKGCKYMYFNERSQRLYVDRDFETWAHQAFDEIAKKLGLHK